MKKRIVYRPVCWCGCEKKLITVKRGGGGVMKKITYKNVCRECGSEKRLITVKHAEGDYHLCQKCFANNLLSNSGKAAK